MTLPSFAPIADEAVAPGRSLHVRRLKHFAENLLWLINNRMSPASVSYLRWNAGNTVRRPTLYSVRWAKFGPFTYFCPPLVGAFGAPREVTVRLLCDVAGFNVHVAAVNATERWTEDSLDEAVEVSSERTALLEPGTAQRVQLQLVVHPGRTNRFYIAFRSERELDTGKLPSDYVTTGGVFASVRTTGEPLIDFAATGALATGLGAGRQTPAFSVSVAPDQDGSVSQHYRECYTVAFSDTDGGDGRMWLAELPPRSNDTVDADYTGGFYAFAPIGVLRLDSVSVSAKQTIQLEDGAVRMFPQMRYGQIASAFQIRQMMHLYDVMHECRLGNLNLGVAQCNTLTVPNWPGIWRMDGHRRMTIGSSGTDAALPYQTETQIARISGIWRQEFRPSDRPQIRVTVPMHYVGPSGVDVTLRAKLVQTDGTVLVTSTLGASRTGSIYEDIVSNTDRWIINTAAQRGVGLDALTSPSLPESQWSHDGCAALNEDPFPAEDIDIPIYGELSAGELFDVVITAEASMQDPSATWGIVAFCNPIARYVSGPGMP